MAKKKKKQRSARKITWAVTLCIFAGVFTATGLAFFQSGVRPYPIDRILMSPHVLMGRAESVDPRVLSRSWVFERVTFESTDRLGRRFVYAVSPKQYDRFYKMIGQSLGVRGKEEELAAQFEGADALVLTLVPQSELEGKGDHHQVVQFAPIGNLFRVELPSPRRKQRWAYFEHSGIHSEARRLLLS